MTKVVYRIQYTNGPMHPPNPEADPVFMYYKEEHKELAYKELNKAKENNPQLEFYMAVKIETVSVINEGDL